MTAILAVADRSVHVPAGFPQLVSVVIPVRNAAGLLGCQLEALSRQDYAGAWEVIIADNGSTDDTAGVAASWAPALPGLRVVSAAARLSASHARNVGTRAARGDIVVFCDADDVATPGWLRAMADAVRGADVVGGRADFDALNSARVRAWRPSMPEDSLPLAFGFLPFTIGASLAVRTDVLRTLGGFDEGYVNGGDDVEFCWRAQLASYTLGYAPGAVMCYRLRDRLWPLAKQAYRYGKSDAHLYRDFRPKGLPPRGARAVIGGWCWLFRRPTGLAARDRAGAWVFGAANLSGRLMGCLRYRVFCP